MSRDVSPWAGWVNAETYDLFVREQPIYRWLNRRLVALADVRAAHRVLDLACGTGATALACLAVLPAEGELVGVDASEAMVQVARTRVLDRRARFAVAAASELTAAVGEPPGAAFDRVVSNAAFWQFPDPAAVLAAVAAVLAPGGLLAFNVPASRLRDEASQVHPFQVALSRAVAARGGESHGGGAGDRDEVDRPALEDALAEAGFELAAVERHTYRGRQGELMELMEIPAMLHRATPGLSAADALAALAQARRRTDPAQPIEVPWIYWLARRSRR